MKSTGIVRKLDELGRITLPIELRRTLNISERDPLEIFVDDERIILKKYEPCDIFTGDMNDLIDYHDKKVSKRSIIEMAKMAGLTIQEYVAGLPRRPPRPYRLRLLFALYRQGPEQRSGARGRSRQV